VTVAGQAYTFLAQMASVVILARLIAPGDFGLVAMVVAVIGVSDLFRDFGLSAAAMRAKHLSREERDNLFWLNTAFGLAATAIVVCCAPLIGMLYNDPRAVSVVMVLSISFTISGMTTQYNADLTRRMRFTAITVTRVVAVTGALVVATIMAVVGAGYWALVGQRLATLLLMMVLPAAIAGWLPGLPHRRTSVRRFIKFGVSLFGTQVLKYCTDNIDSLAIGKVWGSVPLGYYDRGYRLLVSPLTQINAPMMQVALPTLSRVHEDVGTLERYVLKVQLILGYTLSSAFALAAGLAPSLILTLLGPNWDPVVPIFRALAIGGMFRATAQIAFWLFLSADRSGAQLKMSLIVSPIMVLCILAGVPWGAVGVALGSTFAYAAQWAISLIWAARVTKLRPRRMIGNVVRIMAIISVPWGVLGWLAGMLAWPPLGTIAAALGGCAAYLGVLAAVSPATRRDLRVVYVFVAQMARRRPRAGGSEPNGG
jgi:PST family polysaccharide transporter